ncbi:probable protein S-acyltransferase 14 [Arachis stenosperma]|uniref:probable protein S-acyltransferase 14 n=1 Tax=Arachis stenosperma TaxID=217475 RepID=UPI0025ACE964|nr:probable protein S-acyltransferase 14 [Arachis stenosperma]
MHRSRATMTWNVFKFCTALRGLGSIMILSIFGVVGVTYYAVVLTNYSPVLSAGGLDCLLAIAVLILFYGLLIMLLWSYFSIVFTNLGSVPPNWRPAIDEKRGEDDPLVASEFDNMQSDPSGQRVCYCRKCNQLKPPRCHHCSGIFMHNNVRLMWIEGISSNWASLLSPPLLLQLDDTPLDVMARRISFFCLLPTIFTWLFLCRREIKAKKFERLGEVTKRRRF